MTELKVNLKCNNRSKRFVLRDPKLLLFEAPDWVEVRDHTL